MKGFKYVLFLLLMLVIGVSIYIAVQPNSFEVTRTKTIKAPKSVVYDHVIDFKNWKSWCAWTIEARSAKVNLSENTKGVNSTYSWYSVDDKGSITTTDTKLNSLISQDMQLEHVPLSKGKLQFKSNNDGSTDVTWTVASDNLPFKFKMWSVFNGNMEQYIGPDLKNSLEKLDAVVQAEMKVYSINVEGITEHSGGYYLYNTTSSKFNDFNEKMTTKLGDVGAYAITHNISMAGKPFVLYNKWDAENDAIIFSACIPTNSKILSEEPDILTGKLESFRTVKTVLKGDYSNMQEAWDKTLNYIAVNNLEVIEGGPMLQTYLTLPENYPNPADWKAEIYIAIKQVTELNN